LAGIRIMTSAAPHIRAGELSDISRIEPLWVSLYEGQREMSSEIVVSPEQFAYWRKSMEVVFGRFSHLVVAELTGDIVGFVAARIRTLPPHLGGGPAGFISEVFVSNECRGHGLAAKMMASALDWFRLQGVGRVELQVLTENESARKLYQKLGWREELVQMVCSIPTQNR
jgi:ribosomal protein S18 acetylase RimI-like enzyme